MQPIKSKSKDTPYSKNMGAVPHGRCDLLRVSDDGNYNHLVINKFIL